MIFDGITKDFCLTDEQQYDTIGQFWDELAAIYGLENLQGLGYCWKDNKIAYAIGLKNGLIKDCNLQKRQGDKTAIENQIRFIAHAFCFCRSHKSFLLLF